MPGATTPFWVWGFIAVAMVPALIAVAACWLYEIRRPRPAASLRLDGAHIDLWGGDWYRAPRGDAIIVPVASDMRMYTPVAKWVRDASAYTVQEEALRVAPMDPGDAFLAGGGKYRFKMAVLAVVMDDQKRTDTEWVSRAIAKGIRLAGENGALTIILPDMTEDLLRRPQTITEEQRRETARPIAEAMIRGALDAADSVEEIRIWAWNPVHRAVFAEILSRWEEPAQQLRVAAQT